MVMEVRYDQDLGAWRDMPADVIFLGQGTQ